jgi:hypothetical protein
LGRLPWPSCLSKSTSSAALPWAASKAIERRRQGKGGWNIAVFPNTGSRHEQEAQGGRLCLSLRKRVACAVERRPIEEEEV